MRSVSESDSFSKHGNRLLKSNRNNTSAAVFASQSNVSEKHERRNF